MRSVLALAAFSVTIASCKQAPQQSSATKDIATVAPSSEVAGYSVVSCAVNYVNESDGAARAIVSNSVPRATLDATYCTKYVGPVTQPAVDPLPPAALSFDKCPNEMPLELKRLMYVIDESAFNPNKEKAILELCNSFGAAFGGYLQSEPNVLAVLTGEKEHVTTSSSVKKKFKIFIGKGPLVVDDAGWIEMPWNFSQVDKSTLRTKLGKNAALAEVTCVANEVGWDGRCYYIDGVGGTCATGYEIGTRQEMGSLRDAFVGKSVKTSDPDGCCVRVSEGSSEYFPGNCDGQTSKPFNAFGSHDSCRSTSSTKQLTLCKATRS